MDMLARQVQAGKGRRNPSADRVTQNGGVPSRLKVWIKGVYLPASGSGPQSSISGLEFIPDIVKLTTTNSHHPRRGRTANFLGPFRQMSLR
ncbi:hypothetical protein LEMLEM_LOCUS14282 [Lemmus lemmus]